MWDIMSLRVNYEVVDSLNKDYIIQRNNNRKCINYSFTCISFLDPMRCIKANEMLDCMSPCAEKTCLTRNSECTKDSLEFCRVKCVCKNGFYRDNNNSCISSEDCG